MSTYPTFPNTPEQPQPPRKSPSDGLVVVGYILAVLMPLIGFIIGIIVTAKGRTRHGVGHMVVAGLVFVAVLAMMASSASSATNAYADCISNAATIAAMDAC